MATELENRCQEYVKSTGQKCTNPRKMTRADGKQVS